MTRLFDLVQHWATGTPGRVAVTEGQVHTTWGELADQVDAWARRLVALGVRPGDRVALSSRPTLEALVLYLAVGSVGAVFQGLNPAYTAGEVGHVLQDAQPRLILDATGGGVRAVADELALTALDLAVARSTDEAAVDLVALRAGVRGRDAALLVHTSGSTGRPKGALLPHDALVLAARVHAGRWGGADLTTLCAFPINHVASLSDLFGTALGCGGRTVLLERFDADEALRLLVAERVTFWGVIPAAAALVVRSTGWADADLSHVRHVVWGGGAVSPALLADLRLKGLRPSGCYGSTETVGNVCFTDPAETDDDLLTRSLGFPDPAYEVRVEDGSGELLVRSPAPFLGYLNRPDATAEVLDGDGWLRTGDLVTTLPDGSLGLVGRAREMFKSGGYNVYPREVELALEALPGVTSAAVVPVPDDLYGEVGHAAVVAPGQDVDTLLRLARGTLAAFKVPKRLVLVETLPLLPVGKVDKTAVAAILEGTAP